MMHKITEQNETPIPIIKVLGVGGGGCNAITYMVEQGIQDVEFFCANTDAQALAKAKEVSDSINTIQLGESMLGAGFDPKVGAAAAENKQEEIKECIENTDLLFITAGMGGGTGTGAAPVIAKLARENNILTIGVVTLPYEREGKMKVAEEGIENLKEHADCIITIPNEKLIDYFGESESFFETFKNANKVLYEAVSGISHIMLTCGEINIDFQDINKIMGHRGFAFISRSEVSGDNAPVEATKQAMRNPLLDHLELKDSPGVLINITCKDMSNEDLKKVLAQVREITKKTALFKYGAVKEESMEDRCEVIIIATGLKQNQEKLSNNRGNSVSKNDLKQMEISSSKFAEELELDESDEFTRGIEREQKTLGDEKDVEHHIIAPVENDPDLNPRISSEADSLNKLQSAYRAKQGNKPKQGRMTGTDSFSQATDSSDPLDLPAFLRRQAD